MAIAGFVLGLLGMCLFFAGPFGAVLCILGIIFSLLGWGAGLAIAGLIMGIIGLVLLVILVVISYI